MCAGTRDRLSFALLSGDQKNNKVSAEKKNNGSGVVSTLVYQKKSF